MALYFMVMEREIQKDRVNGIKTWLRGTDREILVRIRQGQK